jgi:hypothetical protein
MSPPCISSKGLLERRSWVYQAKNERLIILVDLLVSLAIETSLRCVLDCVRPLGDLPYQCDPNRRQQIELGKG